MSDLPIKDMKIAEASEMDCSGYDITLKRDGTLMYWKSGNLVSPREIVRNDRFSHIKRILENANFPECFGEMYVDNGNVFDVSSRENWARAKFMPIDLLNTTIPYNVRQDVIRTEIANLSSESITPLMHFESIAEGWEYVKRTNGEGLILRNPAKWIKVKILFESKIPIKDWLFSSDKGTFILDDEQGNRISGTSIGFVNQYKQIIANGRVAMAEIEYPFITSSGRYFQPRLRRVFDMENKKSPENGYIDILYTNSRYHTLNDNSEFGCHYGKINLRLGTIANLVVLTLGDYYGNRN